MKWVIAILNHRRIFYLLLTIILSINTDLAWAREENADLDPVAFKFKANKKSVKIGEEVELIVIAKKVTNWESRLVTTTLDCDFRIKVVFPDGFVQTGGNYHDLASADFNHGNQVIFKIKGKFIAKPSTGKFILLRGSKKSVEQDRYLFRADLTLDVKGYEASETNNLRVQQVTGVSCSGYTFNEGQVLGAGSGFNVVVHIQSGCAVAWWQGRPVDERTNNNWIPILTGKTIPDNILGSCIKWEGDPLNCSGCTTPSAPTITKTSGTTVCTATNQNVTLTASGTSGTVSWYRDGGMVGSGITFTTNSAGNYSATSTNGTCSSSQSSVITVSQTEGCGNGMSCSGYTFNEGQVLGVGSGFNVVVHIQSGCAVAWWQGRPVDERTNNNWIPILTGKTIPDNILGSCIKWEGDPLNCSGCTTPSAPTITKTSGTTVCTATNQNVTLTASGTSGTVSWYKDGGMVGTGITFTTNAAGNYSATSANGTCTSPQSSVITISQTADCSSIALVPTISIWKAGVSGVRTKLRDLSDGDQVDINSFSGGQANWFIASSGQVKNSGSANYYDNVSVRLTGGPNNINDGWGPENVAGSDGGPFGVYGRDGGVNPVAGNYSITGKIYHGSKELGSKTVNFSIVASGCSLSAPLITKTAGTTVCSYNNQTVTLATSNCSGIVTWLKEGITVGTGTTYTTSVSGNYTATCTVGSCVSAPSAIINIAQTNGCAAPVSGNLKTEIILNLTGRGFSNSTATGTEEEFAGYIEKFKYSWGWGIQGIRVCMRWYDWEPTLGNYQVEGLNNLIAWCRQRGLSLSIAFWPLRKGNDPMLTSQPYFNDGSKFWATDISGIPQYSESVPAYVDKIANQRIYNSVKKASEILYTYEKAGYLALAGGAAEELVWPYRGEKLSDFGSLNLASFQRWCSNKGVPYSVPVVYSGNGTGWYNKDDIGKEFLRHNIFVARKYYDNFVSAVHAGNSRGRACYFMPAVASPAHSWAQDGYVAYLAKNADELYHTDGDKTYELFRKTRGINILLPTLGSPVDTEFDRDDLGTGNTGFDGNNLSTEGDRVFSRGGRVVHLAMHFDDPEITSMEASLKFLTNKWGGKSYQFPNVSGAQIVDITQSFWTNQWFDGRDLNIYYKEEAPGFWGTIGEPGPNANE